MTVVCESFCSKRSHMHCTATNNELLLSKVSLLACKARFVYTDEPTQEVLCVLQCSLACAAVCCSCVRFVLLIVSACLFLLDDGLCDIARFLCYSFCACVAQNPTCFFFLYDTPFLNDIVCIFSCIDRKE